jgi:hypothetical protein
MRNLRTNTINALLLALVAGSFFTAFVIQTDVSHFTINELCHSSVADSLDIPNRPDEEQTANLHALIDEVLDPLRNAYGRPIRVNSGFRSPALNHAVGGVRNSDHLRGCAADITVGSPAQNRTLFDLAQFLRLPYDQLIDEQNATWIHISHRLERNRSERLKQ